MKTLVDNYLFHIYERKGNKYLYNVQKKINIFSLQLYKKLFNRPRGFTSRMPVYLSDKNSMIRKGNILYFF